MTAWARQALDVLERGLRVALVTVLATEGSAPREAGARMLVTEDGLIGTIGGGATLNGTTWSFAIPDFTSTCIENENHVAELYSFPRFVPIGDFGTDLNITEVATVPAPKCPSCVSGPSCTVTLKLGACV